MAFYSVKTDAESIKDSGDGGNYILNSGMYDVVIKKVIVRSKDGSPAKWLDFIVDYNGTIQTIYRAIGLVNNNGSANFGEALLNKLAIITGITKDGASIQDPILENVCINEKNGTYEQVEVLREFNNVPVTLNMKKRYYRYNGEGRSNMNLKNIFRTYDHASAQEIINDVPEKGKQYAKEFETATNIDYRDGIDEQEARKIDEARMNKGKQNNTSSQNSGNNNPSPFDSMGSEDDVPF